MDGPTTTLLELLRAAKNTNKPNAHDIAIESMMQFVNSPGCRMSLDRKLRSLIQRHCVLLS